jgi:antitoxin PrlF
MNAATITSKGQVTIPINVRTAFNLSPGDKLIFVPEGDRIIVVPVRRRPLHEFAGILRSAHPHPDTDEARRTYREELAARFEQEDVES